MSTKVNSKPPIRLPMDSRIYTNPISAAESRVNPRITLHPMGKINPIVKLKGVIIHNEENSNDNIGMYWPAGTLRIILKTLIKTNSRGSIAHISTSTIIKADRWFLTLPTSLPPIAAPDATPNSQVPRIIPMHSSLPKKTTRNSRIIST
jgi:hypothetical protein